MTNTVIHPLEPLLITENAIDVALKATRSEPGKFEFSPAALDGKVRGEFLRWLLVEALAKPERPVAFVILKGLTVTTLLDLSATKLGFQIKFIKCDFKNEVNLNDATTMGIAFVSGSAKNIEADRLTASGSFELRKSIELGETNTGPFTIGRRLRLCGAEIRGNLDMRGCVLSGNARDDEDNVPLFADGLTVKSNVLLRDGFSCTGEIRLNGAKIRRNLDCSGATLDNEGRPARPDEDHYTLSAAGAQIEGTVYLCRSPGSVATAERKAFTSVGTVRFDGAKVDGDFDCSGAIFKARPFKVPPTRALTKAEREWLYAIKAGGMSVGANLRFNEIDGHCFEVHGAVGLINATIGDDFECIGAEFHFPGEELLIADGMVVSGTTFLSKAKVSGILRVSQATLKEGFYASKVVFDPTPRCLGWFGGQDEDNPSWRDLGGPSCGIYAPLAEVGGTFLWKDNEKAPGAAQTKCWLYLVNSKAHIVRDDKDSWNAIDHFDVNGCQYGVIAEWLPYQWRLDQLDRQYAILNDRRGLGWQALVRAAVRFRWMQASGRGLARSWQWCRGLWNGLVSWVRDGWDRFRGLFVTRPPVVPVVPAPAPPGPPPAPTFDDAVKAFKPQPYVQMARAYRAAGFEIAANDILVHYQKKKTVYSDYGVLRQAGRWLVYAFLRYGFAPFRPVWILLGWALFSAAVFEAAYLQGGILPTKDFRQIMVDKVYYPVRPQFNPLLFAIDTLVPVIDFNQKKSWTVEWIGDKAVAFPFYHPGMSSWDIVVELWRAVPRWGAPVLYVFNTFFGWLLTSLFVAGVGGLLRIGRDEG